MLPFDIHFGEKLFCSSLFSTMTHDFTSIKGSQLLQDPFILPTHVGVPVPSLTPLGSGQLQRARMHFRNVSG